jgi:hypothetical protein
MLHGMPCSTSVVANAFPQLPWSTFFMTLLWLNLMRLFSLPLCLLLCSQNLDDCLGKLQAMLDAGVEAVTPKEIDPETIKRVKAA